MAHLVALHSEDGGSLPGLLPQPALALEQSLDDIQEGDSCCGSAPDPSFRPVRSGITTILGAAVRSRRPRV
jgi:hypothetical protein